MNKTFESPIKDGNSKSELINDIRGIGKTAEILPNELNTDIQTKESLKQEPNIQYFCFVL